LTDDDEDVIEIEQQRTSDDESELVDNGVILVSDSDGESDDQGIDVTDDNVPSVSSAMIDMILSGNIEDADVIFDDIEREYIPNGDEQVEMDRDSIDNLDQSYRTGNNEELIDLTDDEPVFVSHSHMSSQRKLSIDVQQCPICLETLSYLQSTGVYLTITRCHHVMCTLCSRQLLATSSRCPLCRESVSLTTLMPYCILT
jgi:hypothetical protein